MIQEAVAKIVLWSNRIAREKICSAKMNPVASVAVSRMNPIAMIRNNMRSRVSRGGGAANDADIAPACKRRSSTAMRSACKAAIVNRLYAAIARIKCMRNTNESACDCVANPAKIPGRTTQMAASVRTKDWSPSRRNNNGDPAPVPRPMAIRLPLLVVPGAGDRYA